MKPDYANEILAEVAMLEEVDDPCVDNHRFAYEDDAEGMAKYDAKAADGCCGFYDRRITILGRPARIGCNYGH